MNLITRVRISILRNPKKTILLFCLTLLLSSVVSGAILMEQAINNTAVRIRRSMVNAVTTTLDLEALSLLPELPDFEPITREMVLEIAALPYVSHFDQTLTFDTRSSFYAFNPMTASAYSNIVGPTNFFWLNGVSNTRMVQVEEGVFELAEGRLFTEEELSNPDPSNPVPLLIPRVIAEMNNISVGELVNLYQPTFVLPPNAQITEEILMLNEHDLWDHPYMNWEDVPNDFQVIGLLDLDFNRPTHMEAHMMQDVVWNTFFIPNWKVEALILDSLESTAEWRQTFNRESDEDFDFLQPRAFWVLEDSLYMQQFIETAEQILPDYWRIDTWEHVFNPLEGAMETMHWIARQILLFSIGATLLVLNLLISLYLRDRKQEMGIYLALGERKIKIIGQILMEVVLISLVGMTVAIFIGNAISTPFSDSLLRQELVSEGIWQTGSTFVGEWEVFSQLEFMGIGREMTASELASLFEISLDTQTIAVFYGIGLLTIMVSILIPVLYTLKLNLKKTLMQAKIG